MHAKGLLLYIQLFLFSPVRLISDLVFLVMFLFLPAIPQQSFCLVLSQILAYTNKIFIPNISTRPQIFWADTVNLSEYFIALTLGEWKAKMPAEEFGLCSGRSYNWILQDILSNILTGLSLSHPPSQINVYL